MKLLRCGDCKDIFNLDYNEKSCSCGKTRGAYENDGLHAWFTGENATPLGIANDSFRVALQNRTHSGEGPKFNAFVIPTVCSTFEYRHT